MKKFILLLTIFIFSPVFALAAGNNQSYNWAGYVAQSGTYTGVSGSWVVPSVYNDNKAATDVTWVGVGGLSSADIIQAGTQALVNSNGSVSYEAWYELLPSNTQTVPLSVHAGDSISVSLKEQTTNQWTISFKNNTTGQSYALTVNYASSHSSAEWIEELPTTTIGDTNVLLPLDNFGTVQFNNATAIQNGNTLSLSQLGASAYTLVDSSMQTLAYPSTLGADGQSFSVTRSTSQTSQSTAPVQTLPGTSSTSPNTGTQIVGTVTYYVNNNGQTQTQTYVYKAPVTIQFRTPVVAPVQMIHTYWIDTPVTQAVYRMNHRYHR